jgi:uncharacterized protein (DUF885 family)
MKYILFLLLPLMLACSSNTEETNETESEKANKLLDQFYNENVSRHPMTETGLGIKTHNHLWDDISDSAVLAEISILKNNLALLKRTIDYSKLDEQTRLSCELYEYVVNIESEGEKYYQYNYPVTQMFGLHTEVPSFLSNIHKIDSTSDANGYIERLNRVPTLFNQLIANSNARATNGIIPPTFVFQKVLGDCKDVTSGFPFDKGPDSCSILLDFTKKINALKISSTQKDSLAAQCQKALTSSVFPAYQKLMAHLSELEKKSTNDDGAWKFPDGQNFYQFALKRTTTANISSEEIYQTGLKEVQRIQNEMRQIMKQVKFKGDLKSFFNYLKKDPRFYFSNDEKGKAQYLKKATGIIDSMRSQLDLFFITKPKAEIIVKAVEPYREKTSAFAFYQEPAPDGSRPGTYYVSTYDMKSIPSYKMEALAYHEGIPGHHMQIALAQEMKTLPLFRKNGAYQYFMAYVEGWALYTEWLPKQHGFYKDPYSDFGRLSMELLRAVRLVVDAGIHSKKWTRAQAIAYFLENTPMSEFESTREVERYIVWPSQATAYKVGMLKIQELRTKCIAQQGEKFDQRKFHDLMLLNGALPLDMLEKTIENYLKN